MDSVNTYGEPGVDNGVTVGINLNADIAGQVHIEGSQIIVSLNLKGLTANTMAHEGSHVLDAKAYLQSGGLHSVSWAASEYGGYRVAALVTVGESKFEQGKMIEYFVRYKVGSKNVDFELFGKGSFAGTLGTTAQRVNQAKGTIPARVNLYMRNLGISHGSQQGMVPAFPADVPKWR